MGIRRHLKATLGLLAVGGVAFAGAAHADENAAVINQDQVGGKAYHEVTQKGSKNLLYLTQKTTDEGADGSITVEQHGDNNVIGIKASDAETIQSKDGSEFRDAADAQKIGMTVSGKTGSTVEITQGTSDATVSNDKVVVDENHEIDGQAIESALIEADGGNANVTITQSSSNNTIAVGTVKANSGVTLKLTQQDGENNEVYLTNVKTTSGDASITLTQQGTSGSNKAYFGSAGEKTDGTATTYSGAVSAGSISVNLTQDGGALFQAANVEVANELTIQGYSTTTLEQGNGDKVELNYVKSDNAAEFDITQDGSENKLILGSVGNEDSKVSSGGTMTIKANQKSGSVINMQNVSSGSTMSITTDQTDSSINMTDVTVDGSLTMKGYNAGNVLDQNKGKISLKTVTVEVGDAEFDIDQYGKNNSDAQITLNNVTVTGYTDNNNNSQGGLTVEIRQGDSDSKVTSASVTFGHDVFGSLTADIQQDGNYNTVQVNNTSVGKAADITIVQNNSDATDSAEVNLVQIGNGSIGTGDSYDVSVDGNATINIDQDGKQNKFELLEADVTNLTVKGYDQTSPLLMNGDNNSLVIEKVHAADAKVYATFDNDGNAVNNNDIAVDADLAQGDVTMQFSIASSGNQIRGINDDATSADTLALASNTNDGLEQVGVNSNGKAVDAEGDNFLDIEISGGDSNEIGIYQQASSKDENGYSNYFKAVINGAGNKVLAYQSGTSTYADIQITGSSDLVKIYQDASGRAEAHIVQGN